MSSFQAPKRTPSQRNHLEKLVGQYARAHGLAAERTRRWLSTMALIGVLDSVRLDDAPRFLVKGGVSMEVRLGLRARTTKDVDLVFRGAGGELLDVLEVAFAHTYSNFSFRRKGESEPIRDTGGVRLAVQVSFAGREWQTLQLEIGPPEADEVELVPAAISLEDFKLGAPERVACLSLRYQVAQKLHAVTERPAERENLRFWDLLDLILLRALIEDLRPVRAACREIFAGRDTHAWPPDLDVPAAWAEPFARMAAELELDVDVEGAAEQVRGLIVAIEAAVPATVPAVGQTWRRADGTRVHVTEFRRETAVVNQTDPIARTVAVNAIDPAELADMVLIEDPAQPSWLVVVEGGFGGPAHRALETIGSIEGVGGTASPRRVSQAVTARVVAADDAAARQLARAVLPAGAEILSVSAA